MSSIFKFHAMRRLPLGPVSRQLVLVLSLLVLAGCSSEADPEAIRILGTPPGTAVLGVEYLYDLGVDGGDGIPTYTLSNAPRWLAVEPVRNAARKGVVLRGIPGVTGGNAGEADLGGGDQTITLVVDGDGARGRQEFKINVVPNTLTAGATNIVEGEGQEVPKDGDGVERTCIVSQSTAPGVYVPVSLSKPSVTQVEVHFKTEPGTGLAGGANKAEADIDYVSHTGTVTFKPGETLCYVKVAILDDTLAEDPEPFSLVIDEVEQGLVGLAEGGVRAGVVIKDNEPIVSFEREVAVVTEGEEITITARLDRMPEVDVIAEFEVVTAGVEQERVSTAESDDYSITPSNPYQVVFSPDAEDPLTQKIVIKAEKNNDRDSLLDEFLTLRWTRTATSREDDKLIQVYINQWTTDRQIDLGPGAEVKEMLTDDQARVYVAYTRVNPDAPGLTTSEVLIFDRFGSEIGAPVKIPFGSWGNQAYDHVISDIYLRSETSGQNEYQYLYMTGTTIGNTSGTSPGGTDVLVEVWRKDNLDVPFELKQVMQYGTDRDDRPHAMYVQTNGEVITVVGESEGSTSGGGSAGPTDALLVKFNANGSRRVARVWGSGGSDALLDVASTAGSDQVTAAGYSDGKFEEVVLGGKDVVIGSYSEEGEVRRLNQFGNELDNVGSTLAFAKNDVVLGGYTEGRWILGEAFGGEDGFVSYMGNPSAVDSFYQFGTVGNDRVLDVAVDEDGLIFFTGYIGAELNADTAYFGGRDAVLGQLVYEVRPEEEDDAEPDDSNDEDEEEKDPELIQRWLTSLPGNTTADDQGAELAFTTSQKIMLLKEIRSDSGTTLSIQPYNKDGKSLITPPPSNGTGQ